MPKRLVCIDKGTVAWQDYEIGPLAPDSLRIQVEHAAAKHGTEMAMFKGYAQERGRFDRDLGLFRQDPDAGPVYPVRVGNMAVGRIAAVGTAVTELGLGQRVCTYSGFAEVVDAPAARCWAMPDGMPWQSAVCLDPGEFALGAVRDGQVRVGDAVAVFGLGAIGLMVVQIAKAAGAYPVIALDPLASRRTIAVRLGADLCLDPMSVDGGLEIKRATERRGADVVIEYSGAPAAMQHALRGVAYGGTVVMGAYPPPYGAGLDLGAEAHLNVPKIVFSRACSQPDRDHPRWDEGRIFRVVWRMLREGQLTGVPIVQPIVPFDDLDREYSKIATHPETHIKLGADIV